jgi:predicted nucleic acid-binding protein
MIIVDTTVWIDYLGEISNAHTRWLERELSQQRLGLTDLVLYEVLQGIQGDAGFAKVRRDLSKFEVFETGGEEIAVACAQNYRALRKAGYTVRKTIDCLISTFCLSANHSLLHRDHDFDPFEEQLGLKVIHPDGL